MPVVPRAAGAALLAVLVALGLTAPVSPAAAAPAVPDFGATIDAYGTYSAESGCSPVETPGAARFRDLVSATYGGATNIVRPCSASVSGHEEGRALDWMRRAAVAAERAEVEDLLGWLLATDRYGNAHALARRTGVMYLMWNDKMWRAYRPQDGWTPQTLTVGGVRRDCATLGSTYTTACHRDHLHVSFTWDGALARTSYYAATPLAALPCEQRPDCRVSRVEAANDYAASVAVGRALAPTSRTVVVASAWASGTLDGVAAGVLARRLGAPLLLTSPNYLPAALRADLRDRGATRAVVVGGGRAVSEAVLDGLRAEGLTVGRLHGDPATIAAKVAVRTGTPGGHVVLASGAASAAVTTLVAAGAAGALQGSLVLTGPTGELPASSRQILADLRPAAVTVVGGPALVPDAVLTELAATGARVRRVDAATPEALAARTALAVAPAAASREPVVVPVGGRQRALLHAATSAGRPVLLTAGTALHASARYYVTKHAAAITAITALGRSDQLDPAVVDALDAALG